MSSRSIPAWPAPRLGPLMGLLLLLCLLLPPARAGVVVPVSYAGSGNAVLFDAATGSGGWVGAIDEVPDPAIASPLSLVSVVLFHYDAATGLLDGSFEFTDSLDLDSVLFGSLSGRSADADPFGLGGQFEIDYSIAGGRGRFAGFSGFGLAFLDLDPAGTPDNYRESGLLVLSVPAPGTLALSLAALSLLLVAAPRRRRAVGENPGSGCRPAVFPDRLSCAQTIDGPRAWVPRSSSTGTAPTTP